MGRLFLKGGERGKRRHSPRQNKNHQRSAFLVHWKKGRGANLIATKKRSHPKEASLFRGGKKRRKNDGPGIAKRKTRAGVRALQKRSPRRDGGRKLWLKAIVDRQEKRKRVRKKGEEEVSSPPSGPLPSVLTPGKEKNHGSAPSPGEKEKRRRKVNAARGLSGPRHEEKEKSACVEFAEKGGGIPGGRTSAPRPEKEGRGVREGEGGRATIARTTPIAATEKKEEPALQRREKEDMPFFLGDNYHKTYLFFIHMRGEVKGGDLFVGKEEGNFPYLPPSAPAHRKKRRSRCGRWRRRRKGENSPVLRGCAKANLPARTASHILSNPGRVATGKEKKKRRGFPLFGPTKRTRFSPTLDGGRKRGGGFFLFVRERHRGEKEEKVYSLSRGTRKKNTYPFALRLFPHRKNYLFSRKRNPFLLGQTSGIGLDDRVTRGRGLALLLRDKKREEGGKGRSFLTRAFRFTIPRRGRKGTLAYFLREKERARLPRRTA